MSTTSSTFKTPSGCPNYWNREVQGERSFNVERNYNGISSHYTLQKTMQVWFANTQDHIQKLEARIIALEQFQEEALEAQQNPLQLQKSIQMIFQELEIPWQEVRLSLSPEIFMMKVEKELSLIAKQQENENSDKEPINFLLCKATAQNFPEIQRRGDFFATKRGTRYDIPQYQSRGIVHENEDACCCFNFIVQRGKEIKPAKCFAIFDGHGGADVSRFCAKRLKKSLLLCLAHLNQKGEYFEIANALTTAFVHLEASFRAKFPNMKQPGSAACVALMVEGKLFVANAGDCRAMLVHGNEVELMQLSYDHKSTDLYAQHVVTKRGGTFRPAPHCHRQEARVEGSLAVTRALCDEYLRKNGKKSISCHPRVTAIDCSQFNPEEPMYLIVTSDGLTDKATNYSIAYTVFQGHIQKKTPGEIAEDLIVRAAHAGSKDDITVGIVPIFMD